MRKARLVFLLLIFTVLITAKTYKVPLKNNHTIKITLNETQDGKQVEVKVPFSNLA